MLRNIGLLFILSLVFLTTIRRSRKKNWYILQALPMFDTSLEGKLSEIDSANSAYYFQENPKDMIWLSFDPDELRSVTSANASFMSLSRATSVYPAFHFVWFNTKEYRDHAVEVLGCRRFPCISHTPRNGKRISVRHELRLNFASIHTFMTDLVEGKVPSYTPLAPSEWKRNRDVERSIYRTSQAVREFNEVDPEFEARRL